MDNFNQYQPPQPPPSSNNGKGFATASLVLGICSLVIPYMGTLLAIVGLVLGVLGKKQLESTGQPAGMATAGIVMSIIALAWAVLLIFICSCVCNTALINPMIW